MRLMFTCAPDPAAPGAPDFPALLTAAFPALPGQDPAGPGLPDAPTCTRSSSSETAPIGLHDRGVLVPVAELPHGHAGAADRHRRPPDAGHGMPDRRPG